MRSIKGKTFGLCRTLWYFTRAIILSLSEAVLLLLPHYGALSKRAQNGVGSGKMTAPEPARISRQRTGMRSLQDTVPGVGDEGFFLPGVASPEKEDYRILSLVEKLYDVIREGLPAPALV